MPALCADSYKDILYLSRPRSERHPPLPLSKRAAQFAAFAALSGFGDAVVETARVTDDRIKWSEDEIARVDRQINRLAKLMNDIGKNGKNPQVVITAFVPDDKKVGGSYQNIVARVKKIDLLEQMLICENGFTIRFCNICGIKLHS